MNEEEKNEIVKFALEVASKHLLAAMILIKAPNYITGTMVDDESGRTYELTFKLIK